MKIDRAKEMIREKKYNFSEISERLSFSSIHYFSRRFKLITGMTPSEYAASVKSMSAEKEEKGGR
jgi:YesN/AraC family two-component response regulator